MDIDQTMRGSLNTHAKVEQNLNPWGFGNKPEAKAEQTVRAGLFKKGENKPIELNFTQQAEARVKCGYDTIFSALASECAVVNQEGLNFKCTWGQAGMFVAKQIFQCAKNEEREKQEGATLSGGYTEDRFLVELPFNPNHTPKLTVALGQTYLSYGRLVRVKDKADDTTLTFTAKDTGNASIQLKAANFAVKGGSAVGAVCQGVAQNGGFLNLTLEAKPTEPPTPLPTEDVECKNIGTKISGDTCMNQGDCIRSPDGNVFVLQKDGRAVVYNITAPPPKATYWTPGSSWPAMKWKHICIGEMVEYVNGGPGTISANLALGIPETGSSKTIDERALTNWDKTCGATPSLTLDAGKLVLKRANGTICKTYQLIP